MRTAYCLLLTAYCLLLTTYYLLLTTTARNLLTATYYRVGEHLLRSGCGGCGSSLGLSLQYV